MTETSRAGLYQCPSSHGRAKLLDEEMARWEKHRGAAMKKRKRSTKAAPGVPTVIYFSAPWCSPCRAFGPMLAEEAKAAGVTLVKIDVDAVERDSPYADEAALLKSVPFTRWAGDRPGAQSFTGAWKRTTVREWLRVGVEDSKR